MDWGALHHVALIVSDYEKSRAFYVDKLGFEIIREHHRPERNDYKLDLRCGTIELEIFGNKVDDTHYVAPPKRVNHPEACGLRHLAFYVDDVAKRKCELEELGIFVEPIRYDSFTGKAMTFFFDPDGLPLELHE